VSATHFDRRGQTACWPGRALNFTTEHHEVTCGSCRRTRVYRDRLAEVEPARVRLRNGSTSVKKRIARELAKCQPDPADAAVISILIERLAV
jgi:hypothetical protein